MIILVHANPIAGLPPIQSLVRLLVDKGECVAYVGLQYAASDEQILKDLGITYKLSGYKIVGFTERPLLRMWQKLTQMIRPFLLRKWAWKMIDGFKCASSGDQTIVWSLGMQAAALLGDRALLMGKRHIVTLYELGDEQSRNLMGFDLQRLYQSATIVECEYNRAHILMAQKNLPRLPFVLPNKPYSHSRQRNLVVTDAAAARVVESWGARRVFLYQGALQRDRVDLFQMLEALCKGFPECVVAVMGAQNEATEALARKYSNFSQVPRVTPPHHLEVTSRAHVGLAVYKGGAIYGLDPVNAVYCAPNKIFECTGFGIPMLCNDLPGLRYSIGLAKAGECVETIDELNVCAAARKILLDYDVYSQNALRFYESVDLPAIVRKILDFAGGKE